MVLDARGRVDDNRRDVLERDHLALLLAEARKLDLARAVVDDRLLGEGERVEDLLWVLETLAVEVVRADGRDEAERTHDQEGRE